MELSRDPSVVKHSFQINLSLSQKRLF